MLYSCGRWKKSVDKVDNSSADSYQRYLSSSAKQQYVTLLFMTRNLFWQVFDSKLIH